MTHDDTLEHATCEACGDVFTRAPGEGWKRLCLPCWKRSKQSSAPSLGETPAQLRHELHEALEEAARLRRRLMEAEHRTTIPPDMLKRLIALAHPDKHYGSRIATEATQWLLKQREAHR